MPDSSRTAPTARALSRASAQPRQPRPNAAPACPCRRLRSAPPRSTTPRRGCAARPPGAPLRCPQPGGVDKEVRATFSAALLLLSRLALRQRARATEPGGKGGRRPEWVSVGGGRSPPAGEVLPLPGGVGRRAAAEPEAAGSLVAPRFALLPVPTPSGLGAECEAPRLRHNLGRSCKARPPALWLSPAALRRKWPLGALARWPSCREDTASGKPSWPAGRICQESLHKQPPAGNKPGLLAESPVGGSSTSCLIRCGPLASGSRAPVGLARPGVYLRWGSQGSCQASQSHSEKLNLSLCAGEGL